MNDIIQKNALPFRIFMRLLKQKKMSHIYEMPHLTKIIKLCNRTGGTLNVYLAISLSFYPSWGIMAQKTFFEFFQNDTALSGQSYNDSYAELIFDIDFKILRLSTLKNTLFLTNRNRMVIGIFAWFSSSPTSNNIGRGYCLLLCFILIETSSEWTNLWEFSGERNKANNNFNKKKNAIENCTQFIIQMLSFSWMYWVLSPWMRCSHTRNDDTHKNKCILYRYILNYWHSLRENNNNEKRYK